MHPDFEGFLRPDDPAPLQRFVTYWADRRQGRVMPSFDDIDPIDIPWALRNLYVLRVLPDGDFAYRLAGEALAERYGGTLKGKRISDLYVKSSATVIRGRWQRVVEEPAGCYTDTEHPLGTDKLLAAQRITLPLGADGRTADHVIGIAAFERIDPVKQTKLSDGAAIREVRWASLLTSVRRVSTV